jgi:hypothetical protein
VVSPDRRFFAVTPDRSELRSTADGEVLWEAPAEWIIRGIAPDADAVVITRGDRSSLVQTTKLIELDTTGSTFASGPEVELVDAADFIGFAEFSSDGEMVIVTNLSIDAPSAMLFGRDGTLLHRFEELADAAVHLVFTADSSNVVGATTNGDVLVYDVERLRSSTVTDAAIMQRIDAHDAISLARELDPDGGAVASRARGERVRFWDLDTGELIAELGALDGPSPTGTFHRSEPWAHVLQDGTITTHILDGAALVEVARDALTRDLTDAECERYLRASCPDR